MGTLEHFEILTHFAPYAIINDLMGCLLDTCNYFAIKAFEYRKKLKVGFFYRRQTYIVQTMNSRAVQSQKGQLIGKSQWYRRFWFDSSKIL